MALTRFWLERNREKKDKEVIEVSEETIYQIKNLKRIFETIDKICAYSEIDESSVHVFLQEINFTLRFLKKNLKQTKKDKKTSKKTKKHFGSNK